MIYQHVNFATDTISPIGAADVTFTTMGGNANSDPFL